MSAEETEALKARIAELEKEVAECRLLVGQVMEAEDTARRRIAQLIHDDSLQSLLAANQELIEAAPGRAQVMRAHEVVEATIARLRDAMMALHPVTVEEGGFEVALGAVARASARQGGFEVALDLDPGALGVADELMLSVARELLTNAARHSGATKVSVELAPRRTARSSSGSATTAPASRPGGARRRSPRAISASPRRRSACARRAGRWRSTRPPAAGRASPPGCPPEPVRYWREPGRRVRTAVLGGRSGRRSAAGPARASPRVARRRGRGRRASS